MLIPATIPAGIEASSLHFLEYYNWPFDKGGVSLPWQRSERSSRRLPRWCVWMERKEKENRPKEQQEGELLFPFPLERGSERGWTRERSSVYYTTQIWQRLPRQMFLPICALLSLGDGKCGSIRRRPTPPDKALFNPSFTHTHTHSVHKH